MTQLKEQPSAGKRDSQKAATRARILAVAAGLCRSHGFLALRTLDVAREAGLAHGSVFVHFPSREDLLAAVIGDMAAAMLSDIHARVEAGAGFEAVLAGHLDGLRGTEDLYSWLVREQGGLPVDPADELAGVHSTLSWHLAQAAERERRQGRLKDLPDHFLFNCWIGLLHHYLANRERFAPGGSVLERCGPELLRDFLAMVRP
jgi:AcrR family transcriptional regulator